MKYFTLVVGALSLGAGILLQKFSGNESHITEKAPTDNVENQNSLNLDIHTQPAFLEARVDWTTGL